MSKKEKLLGTQKPVPRQMPKVPGCDENIQEQNQEAKKQNARIF